MLTLNELGMHNFERLQAKTVLRSILRSIAQSLRAIIDADMIFYVPIGMYVTIFPVSFIANIVKGSFIGLTGSLLQPRSRHTSLQSNCHSPLDFKHIPRFPESSSVEIRRN